GPVAVLPRPRPRARGGDRQPVVRRGRCACAAVEDETFDAVVFHTTLCHIPEPSTALTEARRVLRSGGRVIVFDGDYETTTVARGETDPLQACVRAAVLFLVHDRFLVRRLPALVIDAGFESPVLRSHGYVEAPTGGYMLSLLERGIDVLGADGTIGRELAQALNGEARRRSDEREFFGHIAYASAIAAKP
ncbi:MAG TPA: methyltransferase domain-containing protein, partial [Gaiellaceae bacterium]